MFALPTATQTRIRDLGYIFYRNIVLLTNGILFAVVVMLFAFGSVRAAIFLGIISTINISVGLIQDIRSWSMLEKLQLLTAPWVTRINPDGSDESVLANDIKKDDHIKLSIGDQVPCDGTLLEAHGFEMNEGLITGESNSLARKKGEKLFAGSLVTSGFGVMRIDQALHESRIVRMTEGIKKYSVNTSSIQRSSERVITYSGYMLILVLGFVVGRGYILHDSAVLTVLTIGTLSSIIVPQGLAFMVTVSFAYGAAHLYKKHVLLQQVNATEMLGRVKNLCMDKTGTLTENSLLVEGMYLPDEKARPEAQRLVTAYIQGARDSSQVMTAVKASLTGEFHGEIKEVLSFSSWRQYGAVEIREDENERIILAGAPDVFLSHLKTDQEKDWLQTLIKKYASEGKHVICLAEAHGTMIPKNLTESSLSVIALFVFHNNLREGIQDTIKFFQDRGVHIRIVSGDHLETAVAVAKAAGIQDTDKAISGQELATWSKKDFELRAKRYTIFARISPEQKEQIVEALKTDGFTAMVGDGANDALAIKKADLGIAMFDGASATRKLAAVVLTNNSFTALPGGVALADGIIRNMEIMASVFLNQTILAFFFFIFVSVQGYAFPLTPFNVTLMNYCIVGLPGFLVSYWVMRPVEKVEPASTEPFLRRVVPFALVSALVQVTGMAAIYTLIPELKRAETVNTIIMLAFVIFCYLFFLFAPAVYYGATLRPRKLQLILLGILEAVLLIAVFQVPIAMNFFDVVHIQLSTADILKMFAVIGLSWLAQYGVAQFFVRRKKADIL